MCLCRFQLFVCVVRDIFLAQHVSVVSFSCEPTLPFNTCEAGEVISRIAVNALKPVFTINNEKSIEI